MKIFGWICFWLGLLLLLIGLPSVFIFSTTPMLIGKILLASGLCIGLGWKWAHPKNRQVHNMFCTCVNCGTVNTPGYRFCGNCGMQLRNAR